MVAIDNDMFDELMTSVQEKDGIVKRKKPSAWSIEPSEPEVRDIRER